MIYGMDDVLRFGKHRGAQIEDVIEDDPEWLAWAVEEGILDVDWEVEDVLERRRLI
jgi:hypothetical protein